MIFWPIDRCLRHALSWQPSKSLPDVLPERSDSPVHTGPPIVTEGTREGTGTASSPRARQGLGLERLLHVIRPTVSRKRRGNRATRAARLCCPAADPGTPGPPDPPGSRADPAVGRHLALAARGAGPLSALPALEPRVSQTEQSRRDPWIWEPGLARTPQATRRPARG